MTDQEIRSNVENTSAYMQKQDGRRRAAEAIDGFLKTHA